MKSASDDRPCLSAWPQFCHGGSGFAGLARGLCRWVRVSWGLQSRRALSLRIKGRCRGRRAVPAMLLAGLGAAFSALATMTLQGALLPVSPIAAPSLADATASRRAVALVRPCLGPAPEISARAGAEADTLAGRLHGRRLGDFAFGTSQLHLFAQARLAAQVTWPPKPSARVRRA